MLRHDGLPVLAAVVYRRPSGLSGPLILLLRICPARCSLRLEHENHFRIAQPVPEEALGKSYPQSLPHFGGLTNAVVRNLMALLPANRLIVTPDTGVTPLCGSL